MDSSSAPLEPRRTLPPLAAHMTSLRAGGRLKHTGRSRICRPVLLEPTMSQSLCAQNNSQGTGSNRSQRCRSTKAECGSKWSRCSSHRPVRRAVERRLRSCVSPSCSCCCSAGSPECSSSLDHPAWKGCRADPPAAASDQHAALPHPCTVLLRRRRAPRRWDVIRRPAHRRWREALRRQPTWTGWSLSR